MTDDQRLTTHLHAVKGHAYGNDFLLVLESEAAGWDPVRLARAICDRHAGLGADGLILYSVLSDHLQMRLYNSDGSRSELSGNGVRCLAAYALQRDLISASRGHAHEVQIETAAGRKVLHLVEREDDRWVFRASMGIPTNIRTLDLEAAGHNVPVIALSVGNPQCVVLGPLDEQKLHVLGPALENHPAFPDRTNVSFAEVQGRKRVRILIWERGAGPTAASGTGACGAAVAAINYGGADRDLLVESPGGTQRVEWQEDGLYLTGWAQIVFEGRWLAESAS